MNWIVFGIAAYLLLALQVGLAEGISIATSWGPVQPRFVLPLAIFVGLSASQRSSMAAWAILGLLLDLTTTWPSGLTFIGPYTLGYLAAGYLLQQMRQMLVRSHPLSLAFATLVCGIAVQLVVLGILAVRSWYDPLPEWRGGVQIILRALSLLYTAGIAAVLALPLGALSPFFGFRPDASPYTRGRTR